MAEFYRLFGLGLSSELPLPEVHSSPESGDADVAITLGRTPRLEGERPGYMVAEAGTLLTIPNVGRYWIEAGRTIAVEPAPGGSERNLRLYLLGSAFGALLHQRGMLPLHANAIEIEGRAVAFMGHSGAGKSTVAAWFHDRGFRVLADDVCVVTFDDAGRPIAHGGIPRLRLWREALEASGRTADRYELSFDDMDKYNVPTSLAEPIGPLELGQVYLLGRAQGDAAIIRRLQGVEAVNALVANTYRGAFIAMIGETKRHLLDCLALVNKAPIFSAERLWGYDAFEDQARTLEEHVRMIFAAASIPEPI